MVNLLGTSRQTKSVKPFLIAEPTAADLVKCCHSAAPIRMATIRLRLAAEMTRYVGNECVCFVDAVIEFQQAVRRHERTTNGLHFGGGRLLSIHSSSWRAVLLRSDQDAGISFVSTRLHLDDEILIGIGNGIDISRRAHLGYERIIAGRTDDKIRRSPGARKACASDRSVREWCCRRYARTIDYCAVLWLNGRLTMFAEGERMQVGSSPIASVRAAAKIGEGAFPASRSCSHGNAIRARPANCRLQRR